MVLYRIHWLYFVQCNSGLIFLPSNFPQKKKCNLLNQCWNLGRINTKEGTSFRQWRRVYNSQTLFTDKDWDDICCRKHHREPSPHLSTYGSGGGKKCKYGDDIWVILLVGFLLFTCAVLYVVSKRIGLLKLQRKVTAAIRAGMSGQGERRPQTTEDAFNFMHLHENVVRDVEVPLQNMHDEL